MIQLVNNVIPAVINMPYIYKEVEKSMNTIRRDMVDRRKVQIEL